MEASRSSPSPVANYVGYKVSKVRWKPQPSGAIQPSEYFAAGSWDDETNRVSIWYYSPENTSSPSSTSPSSSSSQDPELVSEVAVEGDVMDMWYVDEERIAVALSSGGVALLRYRPTHQTITLTHQWNSLHYIQTKQQCRPCTTVASSGVTMVTGGEDGRINVLRVDNHTPLRIIEKADNATVTGVQFSLQTEVLSTSSSGQMKVWDLRQPGNKAARILVISTDTHPLQCLDRCPSQPHLVAVGRGNGSVCFWDLRQTKKPFSILRAHSSDVWELKFHTLHPNHLFTCSQDKSLWHWDASSLPSSSSSSSSSSATSSSLPSSSASSASPWLSEGIHQGKLDITDLLPNSYLPPNSLDIESNHLICGTDSEMIYVVPGLTLR